MPSSVTRRRPSSVPWVTGKPHLVTTCGSSPAACWARTISWVRIVYPALVVGQRVVDQVQHAAGSGRFMIVARNGRYLARTGHDHGIAAQDGLLGGEAGAQAAGAAAGRAVERLERVGEAAFAPGQAGGQYRAGVVVVGQPSQGGGRGLGLVDGQAERGQAPGRGVERGQRRGSVARAPQRRRPPVGPGEPEPSAQRRGQYSLGQDHGADRVGGHVPPGNRGRERESAGRHVRVAAAGPWPAQGGRHHGRFYRFR